MLALEFDGEQHDALRDATRDDWFRLRGIETLRIPNRELLGIDPSNRDWLNEIILMCESRTGRKNFPLPGPPPTQLGEGG